MKPLFAIWGLGALALAGIIQFAATPVQHSVAAASFAPAELPKPLPNMILGPVAAATPVVDPTPIAKPKPAKAKTQKISKKKIKKKQVASKKRKKKSSVHASIRKAERFLNRIF